MERTRWSPCCAKSLVFRERDTFPRDVLSERSQKEIQQCVLQKSNRRVSRINHNRFICRSPYHVTVRRRNRRMWHTSVKQAQCRKRGSVGRSSNQRVSAQQSQLLDPNAPDQPQDKLQENEISKKYVIVQRGSFSARNRNCRPEGVMIVRRNAVTRFTVQEVGCC